MLKNQNGYSACRQQNAILHDYQKKRETVKFYWDVCIVYCSTTEYKNEIQN